MGPLFSGGLVWVGIRAAGLAITIFVGIKLLKWAFRGMGSQGESVKSLIKQGRLEAAGDAYAREDELEEALSLYRKAGSWNKAGHTARRLGEHELAGSCFEKALDLKLAVASFEAASNPEAAARVAAKGRDEGMQRKAASLYSQIGEHLKAGKLFEKTGYLAEAEKCYLARPKEGLGRAAQMFFDAFEAADSGGPLGNRELELAHKAANYYLQLGQVSKVEGLCHRAGFDMEVLQSRSPGKEGGRGSVAPAATVALAMKKQEAEKKDLTIEAPVASLEALVSGAAPRLTAQETTAPTVLGKPGAKNAPPPGPSSRGEASPVTAATSVQKGPTGTDPLPGNPRPSAPADNLPQFSADVTERYEIQKELGHGGMGEVYKARDLQLGRTIALKFLSIGLVGNDRAMKFFKREAQAAAALNHPAIVTIYDIGVLDNKPFISMECIEGTDLSTRLNERGPIPVEQAVVLALHVALALDYAHQRNVVHRDIKPSNVIQARGGEVKILDFGLAKAIRSDSKKTSVVTGTPEYMAPEQLAASDVDGRTDIFALGVMMYEMLTGYMPFEGMIRMPDVTPPSGLDEKIPKPLDAIVLKAIQLKKEDRFQTAGEMAAYIRGLLAQMEEQKS